MKKIKNMIKAMKTEIMNQVKDYFKEEISAILKEIKTQMKEKLEDILLEMITSHRQSKAKKIARKRPNKTTTKTMIQKYHGKKNKRLKKWKSST